MPRNRRRKDRSTERVFEKEVDRNIHARHGHLTRQDLELVRAVENYAETDERVYALRLATMLISPGPGTQMRLTDEDEAWQATGLNSLQTVGKVTPSGGIVRFNLYPGVLNHIAKSFTGSLDLGIQDPNNAAIKQSPFRGQMAAVSQYHRANAFVVRLAFAGNVVTSQGIVAVGIWDGDDGASPTTVSGVRALRHSVVLTVNELVERGISVPILPTSTSSRRGSGGQQVNHVNSLNQTAGSWEMHTIFPPEDPTQGTDQALSNWINATPKLVVVGEGMDNSASLLISLEETLEYIPISVFTDSQMPMATMTRPAAYALDTVEKSWDSIVGNAPIEAEDGLVKDIVPSVDPARDLGVPDDLVASFCNASGPKDLLDYADQAATLRPGPHGQKYPAVPPAQILRQLQMHHLVGRASRPVHRMPNARVSLTALAQRRRAERGESPAKRDEGEAETAIGSIRNLMDSAIDKWSKPKSGIDAVDTTLGNAGRAIRVGGHALLNGAEAFGPLLHAAFAAL